mgnify:CR=1 FL=1
MGWGGWWGGFVCSVTWIEIGSCVNCIRDSIYCVFSFFFFQAEDGIRDLVRSRGLGDVYKRQHQYRLTLRYACFNDLPDGIR